MRGCRMIWAAVCTFLVTLTMDMKQKIIETSTFEISLALTDNPDKSWIIHKNFRDLIKLHDQIRKELRLNPPLLTADIVMANDANPNRVKFILEKYLQTILNERIYFKNKILFNFIGLDRAMYRAIEKNDKPTNFSKYHSTIDCKVANDVSFYYILITEDNQKDHDNADHSHLIIRTYEYFYMLHKTLKMRYNSSILKDVEFPEFPLDLGPTVTNSTCVLKHKLLQKYLNSLFKVPQIGDSFAFRKFIAFKQLRVENRTYSKHAMEEAK